MKGCLVERERVCKEGASRKDGGENPEMPREGWERKRAVG